MKEGQHLIVLERLKLVVLLVSTSESKTSDRDVYLTHLLLTDKDSIDKSLTDDYVTQILTLLILIQMYYKNSIDGPSN